MTTVKLLVLQHDVTDPLLLLEDWLRAAGAEFTVLRLFEGDPVPADVRGYDGLICLGGEMGAWDDDIAPWLPATRSLLATAVRARTPTLGICLGSQLMAAALDGSVIKAPDGPEIGAYITAKRDAALEDPLFADLPLTPDVMHYHYDVVDTLPTGAVLLLTSRPYPNQAWRIGTAAWALQFHIECSAEHIRAWGRSEGLEPTGRLGAALDEAAANMEVVWGYFAKSFVAFAAERRPSTGEVHPPTIAGKRLPLLADTGPRASDVGNRQRDNGPDQVDVGHPGETPGRQ